MAEDFFGELGRSISRATREAVDRTGVFVEAAKITAQITGQQKEVEKLYQKIGEMVYKKYRNGQYQPEPELLPLMDEIRSRSSQMSSMKKNLAEVRSMKLCPNCGELIQMEVAFCPKCGTPTPIASKKASLEKKKREEEQELSLPPTEEALVVDAFGEVFGSEDSADLPQAGRLEELSPDPAAGSMPQAGQLEELSSDPAGSSAPQEEETAEDRKSEDESGFHMEEILPEEKED
ncbi:MAG: zinc ribbon domain-containing protein [Lachnospiraceae bacterium]|nr:zinc ribbon domain-containing protein [Lachnospiraceae bacterium]